MSSSAPSSSSPPPPYGTTAPWKLLFTYRANLSQLHAGLLWSRVWMMAEGHFREVWNGLCWLAPVVQVFLESVTKLLLVLVKLFCWVLRRASTGFAYTESLSALKKKIKKLKITSF